MKPSILSVMSLLALLAPTIPALAGETGTHGGGGWVCREGDSPRATVRWAKLLDLFEAEHRFGLAIPPRTEATLDERLDWVYERLYAVKPELATAFQVSRRTRLHVTENSDLPPIRDATPLATPDASECAGGTVRFEPLAVWRDGHVEINPETRAKLDETQYTALLSHEIVYEVLRDRTPRPEVNSDLARRVNGLLFSDRPIAGNAVITQIGVNSAEFELAELHVRTREQGPSTHLPNGDTLSSLYLTDWAFENTYSPRPLDCWILVEIQPRTVGHPELNDFLLNVTRKNIVYGEKAPFVLMNAVGYGRDGSIQDVSSMHPGRPADRYEDVLRFAQSPAILKAAGGGFIHGCEYSR